MHGRIVYLRGFFWYALTSQKQAKENRGKKNLMILYEKKNKSIILWYPSLGKI